MEITDIRVRLITESKERLRAVCSVTFDDAFVVRDVKVVDGTTGPFVAMPSRKLSSHCPKCRHKNPIRARFCSDCGGTLKPGRAPEDGNGRSRFHRDIAHPINTEFRELIHAKVLEAFVAALEEAGTDPEYDDHEHDEEQEEIETPAPRKSEKQDYNDEREKVRNEYDSLIAGLKGGKGENRHTEERSEKKDRGERENRGGREGNRGGRRDNRDERPQRREERVEKAPAPVAATTEDAADDSDEDSSFGADILTEAASPARSVAHEERVEKAAPVVEEKPEEAVVEPSKTDDEDEMSFGAGLV